MNNLISAVFNSEWLTLLITCLILMAAAEIGFRCGRRVLKLRDDVRPKLISGIEQATLGLLALLLGFTYALVLDRFDKRRELVVEEANSIGTTWLRSSLLPDQYGAPTKELLRQYAESRLRFHDMIEDSMVFAQAMEETAKLQGELWRHAEAASKEAPNNITALYVAALNQMIDISAERVSAGRARIPGGITLLLLIVASFGCFTSNYAAGVFGDRFVLNSVMLPLIITFTIVMIFDFANARQGFVRLDIEPLKELYFSMRK